MNWRDDFGTSHDEAEFTVLDRLQQMQSEWGPDPFNGARNALASSYFLARLAEEGTCSRARAHIQKEVELSVEKLLSAEQLRELEHFLAMVRELDAQIQMQREFSGLSDPSSLDDVMEELVKTKTENGTL